MNLKKLNLGLVALLLGFGLVITQSAFTKKTTGLYYYMPPTQQAWTAPGDPAPDQIAGNYALIGSEENLCSDVDVACTYDFVEGEFVLSTRGKTSIVP